MLPLRACSAAIGLLGLTAGLLLGTGGPSVAKPDTRLTGATTVGSCHQLNREQFAAQSDEKPAVDCSSAHDSVTYVVDELTGHVHWDDADQMDHVAARHCVHAETRYLDTNYTGFDLSAYSFVWFVPTPAQRDQGASWIRCDLVRSDGRRNGPLPAHVKTLGHSKPVGAAARCLTAHHLVTGCSESHHYRAKDVVKSTSRSYPSRAQWLRLGATKCPAAVRHDPKSYFTWPDRYSYEDASNKLLVCYAHTTTR